MPGPKRKPQPRAAQERRKPKKHRAHPPRISAGVKRAIPDPSAFADGAPSTSSGAQLRIIEDRFRALLSATSDVIYQMSPDWRELRHLEGRGFVADTLEPSEGWLEKYILPEDEPMVIAAIQNAIKTKSLFELEHRVRRLDGTVGWTFSRAFPVLDDGGNITEWFGAASDITKIKRAEAALQSQVRLFDGVASTTPDFVYLFDRNGQFLYANRRLLEVWGMQLADIIGKTCRQLGYEQWHHDMHMREIAQVIETKQPIKGEVPFKAPLTGIFGIYEYIFTPVLGASGDVEIIAGTTRDVTDRKKAEEVLRRGNEQLEQLVAERTAKLQELVHELEHFSYSITHDMRAPLRAMRGFAEIISGKDEKCSPEDQATFIQRIIVAAERMDSLIADALHYSKVVRREVPLGPVDINPLLRGMLDTYPEFQAANGHITIDPLPTVIGNEAALTQCFSNLLLNALKFATPGVKPHIRVGADQREETLENGLTNRWVRLWVQDNGIGIPDSMKNKLFQMFTRGPESTAGTGIGLALVRKVVEHMGGKVGVESREGEGSRFWIDLREAPGA